MTGTRLRLFPLGNKKGRRITAPFWGGAAKSGSDQRVVTQRDVDLHAVVEETRRGDLRHVERPRLGYAVEVPGEFATVRNEANDFAVFHVDPLRPAVDVDGAPGKGRYDRALGRGRLRRLAQEVGAHRRGTGGQARCGKRYCEKARDGEFHVVSPINGRVEVINRRGRDESRRTSDLQDRGSRGFIPHGIYLSARSRAFGQT